MNFRKNKKKLAFFKSGEKGAISPKQQGWRTLQPSELRDFFKQSSEKISSQVGKTKLPKF